MTLPSRACLGLRMLWGLLLLMGAGAEAQAPRIDKIDPPGWWVSLPDPMLLVHGENLGSARFSVSGKGVTLARTQTSANGHWVFLWLKDQGSSAQTITVTASNGEGQTQRPFELAARDDKASAHSGLTSADVLYLIMTDRFARGAVSGGPKMEEREKARGWHGGNFAGIEQHLDYLQQVGVTAVWTTPVASNGAMPDSYHGYAATDLYAVDSHFGTLANYRALSDALHARHEAGDRPCSQSPGRAASVGQ